MSTVLNGNPISSVAEFTARSGFYVDGPVISEFGLAAAKGGKSPIFDDSRYQ